MTQNLWQTPWTTFRGIEADFGPFDFDAYALAHNTKVPGNFISPKEDALTFDWRRKGKKGWWNCPYSGTVEYEGYATEWLAAACQRAVEMARRGVFSVGLIPLSAGSEWWNVYVTPFYEWQTFRGRIEFVDPTPGERTSPRQDNALLICRPTDVKMGISRGHTGVRYATTGELYWTQKTGRIVS